MALKRFHEAKWAAIFIALLLAAAPLFLHSCGGGFSDPKTQAVQTSVLVAPETLNGWITTGYGTDAFGFNKIVVLDVTSATGTTSYTGSGHVTGAFLLDTAVDLSAARSDGVSSTITQVPTRAQMDDLIQRTGIDENTVVVLTGDSLLNVGFAYFNFRYWGFPKERLKVLDRTNAAYRNAGFTLETTVPAAPASSTYSVCRLTQNTSLRAPLAEMISVAEGAVPNVAIWDVRAPNEFNGVAGSTAGPSGSTVGFVAFEGHVRGAANLNFNTHLTTDLSTFLGTDVMRSTVASIGVTSGKPTYVY